MKKPPPFSQLLIVRCIAAVVRIVTTSRLPEVAWRSGVTEFPSESSPMRFHPAMLVLLVLSVFGGIGGRSEIANAATLYVDNLRGDDAFDGTTAVPQGVRLGPVRSIQRAMERARKGDAILIVNNGIPYYESLSLIGSRHSGNPSAPFVIDGNGCIISGARAVPAGAWQSLPEFLWKLSPWKKGHAQLLLGQAVVPEHPCPRNAKSLPKIPAGSWSVWKGAIYYQSVPREDPRDKPFAFAYEDVGISLYRVRHVRIRNLTLRHFRLDGVNGPDLNRDVTLNGVSTLANGRAGVAIGGTSELLIRDCDVAGNRRYSVLIRGLAGVEVEDSRLSKPPEFID
jgi:hypothetical protein